MKIHPRYLVTIFLSITCLAPGRSQALSPSLVERRPGVVRIGVLMPNYQSPSGTLPGEPIRSAEEQLLFAPNLQLIDLSAADLQRGIVEAEAQACDFLLTSSVRRTPVARSGRLTVLRLLNPSTGMASGIGITRTLARLQTSLIPADLATVSTGIDARSQLTFEYSLNTVPGGVAMHESQTATATFDGQDVLTPLLQTAVSRIRTFVSFPANLQNSVLH